MDIDNGDKNITSSNQNGNTILLDIDKKIRIKHHKEKNKNKTCVYGIYDFVAEKEIDPLIKVIKKRFGCSGIVGEDVATKSKILIFSGNIVEDVKNLLLEMKVTDSDHIKT